MRYFLTALIASALLSSSLATAKPSKELPFVGDRYFSFYFGGNAGNKITIKPNGDTTIWFVGFGDSTVQYKGKFSNPLYTVVTAGEETGYKFHYNGKISQVDENGKILTCEGINYETGNYGKLPCTTDLQVGGL